MADEAEPDDYLPVEVTSGAEMRTLLGMFDTPAYARRGQDLEYALSQLHGRCRRERKAMLEMVQVRLRQWAAVASGPDDWRGVFEEPVAALWDLADAPAPTWAPVPGPARRRRVVARELVASLERFNRRWDRFLGGLDLGPYNQAVDLYNRYYLLEKECSLGSSRLAAQHFTPELRLTLDDLLADYPRIPVPGLVRR